MQHQDRRKPYPAQCILFPSQFTHLNTAMPQEGESMLKP
uniref:Uncharacterized protein n=1 Tax=Anguilla anguilla TaxID=7936 RepID=A0A0E9S435_ANGAN